MNPWKIINKTHPKIIDFNSFGDMDIKNVHQDNVINVTSTIQAMSSKNKKKHRDGETKIEWNSTFIMYEIRDIVYTMYSALKEPKKLKVLINCNKHRSACRFLACPNIKRYCILCEVHMREREFHNTTDCERFPTGYLTM